jgi:predicted GIY-YIG superfamily endonuclease
MKKCSKCSELKPVEMFAKCKANKDGLQRQCKQCKKQHQEDNKEHYQQYLKQWHLDNKGYREKWYINNSEYFQEKSKQRRLTNQLSYHIVYLLPDHNYVGVTNNPLFRMDRHRSKFNRNTDNWIELARFESREDALKHEAEYHDKGYEGRAK